MSHKKEGRKPLWLSLQQVCRMLLAMAVIATPMLRATAQHEPPKKASIQRASRYSYLPSGYAQVGTTQLYYNQSENSIDVIGFYNGYYYSSTYGDNGYKLSVQVGDNSAVRVDCMNGTTNNGVTVKTSIEQQGELARICYTVTNANNADVVISLGTHADVMIGNNDAAPIERRIDTFGQTYGLTMKDGNGAQLCVLFGSGLAGVTAVSDFWFGHWSDNSDPYNMVGNYYTAGNWMIENGSYDSGMGWCWKERTIAAGSTVIFSYVIGVGEVNLEPNSSFEVTPDDPEGWNDLSRPHKLTLEGSYESPAGLDGRIEYAVEDGEEWTALTEMLPSGSTFTGDIIAMFDASKAIHVIRFRTVDNVGNTSMLHPIEYKDVSFCPVTGIEEKTYTGAEVFQENLTCELDDDLYTVKNYLNNVRVGQASFTVEGVFPNTIGRKVYTFQILPQPLKGELQLVESEFVYNGSAFTPEWHFSNEDYSTLIQGEDYTVEWLENQLPGTGTLRVTGQNNYTGTLAAEIVIDKAPLPIEHLGLSLPAEELIYDELPHPAEAQPIEGVGTVSFTYLVEESNVEGSQPPTLPGSYKILVTVAEGSLYYGMEKTEVGTVTISLFNTEQYAYISKIATDTENYHMYCGTREKLVQFLQSTSAALQQDDLSAIHEAFLPQEILLAEAQASMADYDKLPGYIYYVEHLLDTCGSLFTDQIKTTIQETIAHLQTAYEYEILSSEDIQNVWPSLQQTTREELTKFLAPHIEEADSLLKKGLVDEVYYNMENAVSGARDLLTWSQYSIGDIDIIKVLLSGLNSAIVVATSNAAEVPTLRQAYEQLGGKNGGLEDWQFDTIPYSVPGVHFVDGYATDVSLTEHNLTGNFPTAFLQLPKLDVLRLHGNQLSGDIAQALSGMVSSQQTSSLKCLEIADNQLSGNLGLLGVVCPQLEALYADSNHFEDCFPALPSTLTTWYWAHQSILRTWDFTLGGDALETALQQLPTILLYDHAASDGVATTLSLTCVRDDSELYLNYDNGQLNVSANSVPYMGQSGDTLTITCYSGSAYASTFKVCLRFSDGDANFNGRVDITDLQTIVNYIFKEYENLPFNFTAANLYEDDRINVQDVVRMVDVLLAADVPAGVKKNVPSRAYDNKEEETDAHLYWRGNELVLETTVPVTSADIRFSGDAVLTWNLQQMGFMVSEKRNSAAGHVVVYSLVGAEIPVGETVVATKGDGRADMTTACLSDKQARLVSTSFNSPDVTHVGQLLAEDGAWTLYSSDGSVVARGRGTATLKTIRGPLAAGVYILQLPNNRIRKITIK